MSVTSESTCQVPKEDGSGLYRLHTFWCNNAFKINILGPDIAWTGEMTKENAETMSSHLNINTDEYLTNCREQLTAHNGRQNISYAVENGQFVWKKVIDPEAGIKGKLGAIMIKPTSYKEAVEKFLSFTLSINSELEKNVKNLSSEEKTLKSYNEELLKNLNQLTAIKDKMESQLYSSFLIILNKKKDKIKELEEALGTGKHSKTPAGCSKELPKCQKTTKPVTSITNSEKCYTVETDEDSSDNENQKTYSLRTKHAHSSKENVDSTDTVPSQSKLFKQDEDFESDATVSDDGLMAYQPPRTDKNQDNQNTVSSSTFTDELVTNTQTNSSLPTSKRDLLNFFYGGSPENVKPSSSKSFVNQVPQSAAERLLDQWF